MPKGNMVMCDDSDPLLWQEMSAVTKCCMVLMPEGKT